MAFGEIRAIDRSCRTYRPGDQVRGVVDHAQPDDLDVRALGCWMQARKSVE